MQKRKPFQRNLRTCYSRSSFGFTRETETKKEEEKGKSSIFIETSQEEKFVPDNTDAHAIQLLLEVLHADALRLLTTLDQTQNLHKDSTSAKHNSKLMLTQSKRARTMKKNGKVVYINICYI